MSISVRTMDRWRSIGKDLKSRARFEPIPDAAVLPTALARPFLERRLGELLPSAGLRINIRRRIAGNSA